MFRDLIVLTRYFIVCLNICQSVCLISLLGSCLWKSARQTTTWLRDRPFIRASVRLPVCFCSCVCVWLHVSCLMIWKVQSRYCSITVQLTIMWLWCLFVQMLIQVTTEHGMVWGKLMKCSECPCTQSTTIRRPTSWGTYTAPTSTKVA